MRSRKLATTDSNSSLSSSADNSGGVAPNTGLGKLPSAPRMQAFHMPTAPLPPLTPTPSLQVSPPVVTAEKPKHMHQKLAEYFLNPPVPTVKVAHKPLQPPVQAPAPAAPAPSGLAGLMGSLMNKFYPQKPGVPPVQPVAPMMAQKPAAPAPAPAAPAPGSSLKANQSVMGSNRMSNKLKGLGF